MNFGLFGGVFGVFGGVLVFFFFEFWWWFCFVFGCFLGAFFLGDLRDHMIILYSSYLHVDDCCRCLFDKS